MHVIVKSEQTAFQKMCNKHRYFVFAIFQGSFFRTQDTMFGSETFGETVIVCNIKHLIRKKWNIGTFGNAVSRYSSAIYLELE